LAFAEDLEAQSSDIGSRENEIFSCLKPRSTGVVNRHDCNRRDIAATDILSQKVSHQAAQFLLCLVHSSHH
jgi:hypothetical protein